MEDLYAYIWTPPPGWPRPRVADPLDVMDIAREVMEMAGGIEFAVGLLDADLGLFRVVVDPPAPALSTLLFPGDDQERIAPEVHGFFLLTGETLLDRPTDAHRRRFTSLRREARETGLVFVDWVLVDGEALHSMRLAHRRDRRHRRGRSGKCV